MASSTSPPASLAEAVTTAISTALSTSLPSSNSTVPSPSAGALSAIPTTLTPPQVSYLEILGDQDPVSWAATAYLTANLQNLGMLFIVAVVGIYEYLIHLPDEATLWRGIFGKKQMPTRAFLPWATLLLRYTMLATSVTGCILNFVPRRSGFAGCYSWTLGPVILLIFLAIFTGAALSWRSLRLARVAITSRWTFRLVAGITGLFVAVRTIATTAIIITISKQISDRYGGALGSSFPARFESSGRQATCFGFLQAAAVQNTDLGTTVTIGFAPILTILIFTLVADSVFTTISCVSLYHIRRQTRRKRPLLSMLLYNSFLYLGCLFAIEAICIALYCWGHDSATAWVVSMFGGAIGVRMLLSEQKWALSRVSTTNARPAFQGPAAGLATNVGMLEDRRGGGAQVTSGGAARGAGTGGDGAWIGAGILRSRGNGAHASGGGGGGGRGDGAARANGFDVWRCDGMTDIEAVTVLAHGRSVDRPVPRWADETHANLNLPDTAMLSGGVRSWIANVSPRRPASSGRNPNLTNHDYEEEEDEEEDDDEIQIDGTQGQLTSLPRGSVRRRTGGGREQEGLYDDDVAEGIEDEMSSQGEKGGVVLAAEGETEGEGHSNASPVKDGESGLSRSTSSSMYNQSPLSESGLGAPQQQQQHLHSRTQGAETQDRHGDGGNEARHRPLVVLQGRRRTRSLGASACPTWDRRTDSEPSVTRPHTGEGCNTIY